MMNPGVGLAVTNQVRQDRATVDISRFTSQDECQRSVETFD